MTIATLPRIQGLLVAAALAFPDGSMAASGLRREATRERLSSRLHESGRLRTKSQVGRT